MIQIFERDEMIDRSLNFSETQDMMSRLTANRN